MKHPIYSLLLMFCIIGTGCSPIQIAPEREKTGTEQYPTHEEQWKYDNFMLGRLKYYEMAPDYDLVTVAFVDSRSNHNQRLDDGERLFLKAALEKARLYFTIGYPVYDTVNGRELPKPDPNAGMATNNPLDYFLPQDQKRWQKIHGCYLSFEDARIAFNKVERPLELKNENLWGVIEVDFTPLRFGRPITVLRAWRFSHNDKSWEHYDTVIRIYKLHVEITKLLMSDFKMVYVP